MIPDTTYRNPAATVIQAKAGDHTAFEVLVQSHYATVLAIAAAHLRDDDAAQDLAQEIFLRAYISLPSLADPDRFSPWIARMARNLAIDWIRTNRRRSQVLLSVPLDEDSYATLPSAVAPPPANDENNQLVERAVQKLSAKQREVVLLHFADNLSQDQIAERLGVHRTTVSRILDRSIFRLRNLITLDRKSFAFKGNQIANGQRTTRRLLSAFAALSAAEKASYAAITSGAPAQFSGARWAQDFLSLGGSTMGKLIIGAVLLSGTIAVVISTQDPPSSKPSSQAIQNEPSLVPDSQPDTSEITWEGMIAKYLRANPDNVGLSRIADALAAIDKGIMDKFSVNPSAIFSTNWAGPTPLMHGLMAASSVLSSANTASTMPAFFIPTGGHAAAPQPDPRKLTTLFKIMVANGCRLQAQGDFDGAANQFLAAMRISNAFAGDNALLQTATISMSGEALSARAMARLLWDTRLPKATAETVATALIDYKQRRRKFSDSIRMEGKALIATALLRNSDPAYARRVPQPVLSTSDIDVSYRAIASNLETTFPHRRKMDDTFFGGISNKAPAAGFAANVLELAVRRDSITARLGLCQMLAHTATSRNDTEIDPFTGKAFLKDSSGPYSAGPDSVDNKRQTIYDPTNGTYSGGDLVP